MSGRQADEALAATGMAVTRISEPRLIGGAALGRYVIKDVLGSGGMGVVYRAHDPELGRLIALKVVHPGERDMQQSQSSGRLVREAQAMARLAHPNVIVVHDAGTVGDRVFVAMELVDGENLATWEQTERRPWRTVIDVYTQAARGLAAAHDAGLVHRDFKPANALIARDGRVRVLDFGLARTLDSASPEDVDSLAQTAAPANPSNEQLTQTGAVMGTPQFMSPEQHLGTPADARSDQFSLCVALYHALYGAYPFTGKTFAELAVAVTTDTPVPPPRRSDVPPAVGRVVMRGLQREPAKRFASIQELLAALEAAMPRKRWPLIAGLAAITALAVVVVALALTRRSGGGDAPIAMAFARNQQPASFTGVAVATPALSPDGKRLVYSTPGSLEIRDLTTGTVTDLHEWRIVWDIRWSPTGDQFVTATQQTIVIRNADGSIAKEIPYTASSYCRTAWSPDATEILSYCETETETKLMVTVIATATSRPLAVKLPVNQRIIDFDWSRAGIVLATGRGDRGSLFLASSDGTNVRNLGEDRSIGSVRWNTGATRIYYSRIAAPGFEIVYRSPTSGSRPVVLLVQPQGQFASESLFAIARDEKSLIYTQRRISDDLSIQPLPVTAPRPLTADGRVKFALSVAADHTAVAFASGSPASRLYHLPIADGAPTELNVPADTYNATSISPNGKEVAFTALHDDGCHLGVVAVAGGAPRSLTTPKFWCERIDWLPTGRILVMKDDGHNLFLVDPAANTSKALWPSDAPEDLRWYALSRDGKTLVAAVSHDQSSAVITIELASRTTTVVSPTSSLLPIGLSDDGAWVYGVEQPADDQRVRVIARKANGDGTSRLIHVLAHGGTPLMLPNESGLLWVPRADTMDLWLASIEPRPELPRAPPAPPPPPAVPPAFHAAPKNLPLVGAAGGVPDGWEVKGMPKVPALTSVCGRPGTCVELDGDSNGAVFQHIDATPYRGRRIRVRVDLRVKKTTAVVVVDSGIYARAEVPSGQLRVRDQEWEKREVLADIAPDAIYIELKILVQRAGTAWVGGFDVELVNEAVK